MKRGMYKVWAFGRRYGGKIIFFAAGIASLIWFLVRVIPKPSRAAYPCMKAAFPMASAMVVYLIGITSFTMLMRKARERLLKAKYLISAGLIVLGLAVGFSSIITYNVKLKAFPLVSTYTPNEVYGEGVGIFPGRVVWQHNSDATAKGTTNEAGDYWYQNTDQEVVSEMLSEGLQIMTGAENDTAAWEAIFKYYNNNHGRGDVGYQAGEEIVIKTNNNAPLGWMPGGTNTAPEVTYAILHQLINIAGVSQSDISIGDPNCNMPDYTYNHCKGDFPDVTYWGATAAASQDDNEWYLSDGEAVDPLPKAYSDADYMINIPVLKKHHRAGISIAAKNHFGSVAPFTSGAWHLHYSLPCPEASGVAENGGYGEYRCFVDIMGHEDLGGKTILYLVDGLWGSTNWGHPPVKWDMEPFRNDWPSSLFLSQDPVAIESVCLDFLFEEFDEDHPTEGGNPTDNKGPFPHFQGTDDYLRQAADPSLRPFDYDPEDDGTILGSLGVHERWNNATDKLYSRNMGLDEGIELVSPYVVFSVKQFTYSDQELTNYPNPFSERTTVKYQLDDAGTVLADIYTISGQQVYSRNEYHPAAGSYAFTWDGSGYGGNKLPAGQYILQLKTDVNGRKENHSIRMMVAR